MKTMSYKSIESELGNIINKEIEDYSQELMINVDKTVEKVAKEFENDLKSKVPYGTIESEFGHLRDNLNTKEIKKKDNSGKAYAVNFGKKSFLATWLEFGVKYSNGNFHRHQFIRPLFDGKKDYYFNQIKNSIANQKRGG